MTIQSVEVLSDSAEKNDRGIKFEDYAVIGVEEYWIINRETLRAMMQR